MKKILIFIIVSACPFFLVACDDDDFASYEYKRYEISKSITGNVFIISDVEEELKNIATYYIDEPELVYAEYYFYNNDTGYAKFNFVKNYEKGGTGYTISLDLYVDVYEKNAYEVIYMDGISKRVMGNSGASSYIGNKEENTFDIYNSCANDYKINTNYIMVSYSNDKIYVKWLGEENNVIDFKTYNK